MNRPFETATPEALEAMLNLSLERTNHIKTPEDEQVVMQNIGYLMCEQLMRIEANNDTK